MQNQDSLNKKEGSEDNENEIDGNLSNNNVKTEIEPTTQGNNVNISLCSCTLILSCIIS